jgi:membrane-bound lytic murein transglycosylase A
MERQSVHRGLLYAPLGLAALLLAACANVPTSSPTTATSCAAPGAAPACTPCPVCAVEPRKPPAPPLQAANWSDLPGWSEDDVAIAFAAFNAGCNAVAQHARWRAVCAAAKSLGEPDNARARAFFEARLRPFQVVNPDATTQGLVTGYYEPLLNGSRERRSPYLYPVYATPDDLLVIDLATVEPQLKGLRLRGRVSGNRVVPYLSRAEIERADSPLKGKELLYVDDPVELFFLQIQGSGRIRLDTGETVRLGYAEQNGHPYQSIGRYLVEQGELKLEQASMQGIKAWGLAHPEHLQDLLNRNPSYVFFRESRHQGDGPLGALGVPLTPLRSIAVDPRVIPLGAPVFLSTTLPDSTEPLNRLMMAQDTGGAIRGAVRADFFWGFGPDAGRLAGKMRQRGAMWVLLPDNDATTEELPDVKR